MPGTAVDADADASAHPPTTRMPPSTVMKGTTRDALLSSADADKAPKVSDPDGLEPLAGSVGFQVEATEPERLPHLLVSTDATRTEVSVRDGLEDLAGMVGFHVEATGSNRLPRLLASADANLSEVSYPDGLEKLFRMLVFHVETPTDSDHPLKTNLTICEVQDGAHSSYGDTLMLQDMIRSQLGFPENQQMRFLKQIAEVTDSVRMSWGTIIHMDGINCSIWKFHTGEPLMRLSMLDLINPFPPVHSSIVQATTTWSLRTLVRYDDTTWYSQARRDWPSMPDSVLQVILSNVDCTSDFHAFVHSCKSWHLASSFFPRPLLLHPLATPTWLFVTPGGRWNNTICNFRLFPALRMKEHSTLIGGSTKFLILLENSFCYVVNIHTGQSKEIHVPYGGVQRGVLSAPPDSANSSILLVTRTSVLCKSVNGSDQWRVQTFGDILVGQIEDIVFVGEMAYVIDNRSRLFIITPDLEISFCALVNFLVPYPTAQTARFGRSLRSDRQKLACRKNWLLEHRGQLLRLFLMSYSRDIDTGVCSGFFMARIGSNEMYEFWKKKSESAGLPFSENCPKEKWIEMERADLGDASVLLNSGNPVASIVLEKPARWGLKSGHVFTCGPDVFPWLSFNLGWVREDVVIPENIRWPCPVFMDSGFSFAAAEELDYLSLFHKAPEPTALNPESAASSSRTLPSDDWELSSKEEAN